MLREHDLDGTESFIPDQRANGLMTSARRLHETALIIPNKSMPCNLQALSGLLHGSTALLPFPHDAEIVQYQRVEELSLAGARIAFPLALRFVGSPTARIIMNLTIWLPAMFLLGLATLGLMFAFLAGCEKV